MFQITALKNPVLFKLNKKYGHCMLTIMQGGELHQRQPLCLSVLPQASTKMLSLLRSLLTAQLELSINNPYPVFPVLYIRVSFVCVFPAKSEVPGE